MAASLSLKKRNSALLHNALKFTCEILGNVHMAFDVCRLFFSHCVENPQLNLCLKQQENIGWTRQLYTLYGF